MQNVTGSPVPAQPDDRDEVYRAVVADLTTLIEHIQTSLTRIDAALAREAAATLAEPAANIVVLDDVTPRYLKAGAALRACDAGLGMALHFLREPVVSGPCSYDSAGGNHLPAHASADSSHSTIN